MKELHKTLIFIAVALVLTGAAAFRMPGSTRTDVAFNDQGKPFFPDFKDPMACTNLEVVDYDPATATASRFEVKLKDGKWVIPSHYDYPADAKDRLAKTAAGVMDLTKDTIRSDRVEDQEELGVIDPLDNKTTTLKGRGKRVTLRDLSEKVLADFIIGGEIKRDSRSQEREGPRQRYVRVPNQKRIYGVNLKAELSTKFADWIETNLLKLDTSKIRKIVFDSEKVDPERQMLIPGEVLTLERKDASGPWTLSVEIPAGQELNTEKINDLTTALSDLKIVGVRRKPPGLTSDLRAGDKGIKPTEQTVRSLVGKGFYPVKDGRVLSNQGQVLVSTDEGVVYTLRFGEVDFATGEALSAGVEDSAAQEPQKKPEAKKGEGGTESRYVMVTVAFDPTLIPEPRPEPPPAPPTTLPEDVFQKLPNDPKRIAEEKEEKDKADQKKAEQERKIADGKKRVQELADRFAGWYYLTPGSSFRSIALERPALLKAKSDRPEGAGGPPGMPSFPGMPGTPNLNFPHP